jgi:hypothetical protein
MKAMCPGAYKECPAHVVFSLHIITDLAAAGEDIGESKEEASTGLTPSAPAAPARLSEYGINRP